VAALKYLAEDLTQAEVGERRGGVVMLDGASIRRALESLLGSDFTAI